MLDVHPPHAPTDTRRNFFLHIATIAIGLEQSVEFVHHRHQIRDALAAEHQENIRRYHINVADHLLRLANHHSDQRVLRYLLAHEAAPEDKLPGVITFGAITIDEPVEAAWSTVQHSDVASLLPHRNSASTPANTKSSIVNHSSFTNRSSPTSPTAPAISPTPPTSPLPTRSSSGKPSTVSLPCRAAKASSAINSPSSATCRGRTTPRLVADDPLLPHVRAASLRHEAS